MRSVNHQGKMPEKITKLSTEEDGEVGSVYVRVNQQEGSSQDYKKILFIFRR